MVELRWREPLTLARSRTRSRWAGAAVAGRTTGTIPVEVAWRARLATLSEEALRAAIVIALAENGIFRDGPEHGDLLAGRDRQVEELQAIGAVKRVAMG